MTVHVSRHLPSSVEETWAVMLDVRSWWPATTLDPRPGGRFEEHWTNREGKPVVTSGEVLALDPPRLLRLSWRDPAWNASTTVELRLEPAADGGTDLLVVHSGWDALPDGAELAPDHEAGWRVHLDQLAHRLDTV